MYKLKIAKEKIYGIITGHPIVVTFCLGLTLAALISTAVGIASPQHAMAGHVVIIGRGHGPN